MTLARKVAPRKISAKKLKALNGKIPFSTITSKPSRPRAVNPPRKAREFARCYHSKERVAFVKSLACFATGIRGKSDNAHVTRDGTEGMGRKGGYKCIAPLTREAHRLLDTNPARFTERFGEFDFDAQAAWTERAWQRWAALHGIDP